MASGHVNRTNRPNTWLLRPALHRVDFPCQPGAVHTWHIADVPTATPMPACWGKADSAWSVPLRPSLDPNRTSCSQPACQPGGGFVLS
jgi:hypothetical protein